MSSLGIEIIGDLRGIEKDFLELIEIHSLEKEISKLILKHGFSELGRYYHDFAPGITGAVVLMESHVAFHTWPEFGYVSLNVFTCNYSQNNDEKAIDLFYEIASLFQPSNMDKKIVYRDH